MLKKTWKNKFYVETKYDIIFKCTPHINFFSGVYSGCYAKSVNQFKSTEVCHEPDKEYIKFYETRKYKSE
jgi:hypothetical protein